MIENEDGFVPWSRYIEVRLAQMEDDYTRYMTWFTNAISPYFNYKDLAESTMNNIRRWEQDYQRIMEYHSSTQEKEKFFESKCRISKIINCVVIKNGATSWATRNDRKFNSKHKKMKFTKNSKIYRNNKKKTSI